MKINWKLRLKNKVFITQIILAVLTPILAYAGITASDITSWSILGNLFLDALSNPYVLSLVVVSVWNAVNDPTTKGISDSELALSYDGMDVDYEIEGLAQLEVMMSEPGYIGENFDEIGELEDEEVEAE